MLDGVVKSAIYGVVVICQTLGIRDMYRLVPDKPQRLVYGPFSIAIPTTFMGTS